MYKLLTARHLGRIPQQLLQKQVVQTQIPSVTNLVRHYWNKDWAAGPYPKTEEERRAAAKKYGMLPEDYKPYPDDGFGVGDYPQLPLKGADSRSPYEDWDYPSQRRNYGEPLHIFTDILGEDRWQPDKRYWLSLGKQYLILGTVISAMVGLAVLAEGYKKPNLMLPKQYPYQYILDGKSEKEVHYEFAPAE